MCGDLLCNRPQPRYSASTTHPSLNLFSSTIRPSPQLVFLSKTALARLSQPLWRKKCPIFFCISKGNSTAQLKLGAFKLCALTTPLNYFPKVFYGNFFRFLITLPLKFDNTRSIQCVYFVCKAIDRAAAQHKCCKPIKNLKHQLFEFAAIYSPFCTGCNNIWSICHHNLASCS